MAAALIKEPCAIFCVCLAHVFHRAVMQVFEKTTEGGHNFDANPAIKKVVELSTYMHRSTKVASQFRNFQTEYLGRRTWLGFITPSPTRWGGYHAAMQRYLQLHSDWCEFLN